MARMDGKICKCLIGAILAAAILGLCACEYKQSGTQENIVSEFPDTVPPSVMGDDASDSMIFEGQYAGSNGEEVTYYIDDDMVGETGIFAEANSVDYEPVELSGTVMLIGDDRIYQLTSDEAKIIYYMLCNYKWNNEGVAESIDDCDLVICGQAYTYSSSCGCFNDRAGRRFLQLSDENAAKVNEIMSGYVTLE